MYIQYKYSARTPLYYLLLIVFVKGLHLFLILLRLISLAHRGQTTATETDGPTWLGMSQNSLFMGSGRVEKIQQRRGVRRELPPIYKHNFVTFCQMMFVWFLQPNLFLFIHSTWRVKIIPRSLKRTKNILAVNLCKEIVAKKGKKKT